MRAAKNEFLAKCDWRVEFEGEGQKFFCVDSFVTLPLNEDSVSRYVKLPWLAPLKSMSEHDREEDHAMVLSLLK